MWRTRPRVTLVWTLISVCQLISWFWHQIHPAVPVMPETEKQPSHSFTCCRCFSAGRLRITWESPLTSFIQSEQNKTSLPGSSWQTIRYLFTSLSLLLLWCSCLHKPSAGRLTPLSIFHHYYHGFNASWMPSPGNPESPAQTELIHNWCCGTDRCLLDAGQTNKQKNLSLGFVKAHFCNISLITHLLLRSNAIPPSSSLSLLCESHVQRCWSQSTDLKYPQCSSGFTVVWLVGFVFPETGAAAVSHLHLQLQRLVFFFFLFYQLTSWFWHQSHSVVPVVTETERGVEYSLSFTCHRCFFFFLNTINQVKPQRWEEPDTWT